MREDEKEKQEKDKEDDKTTARLLAEALSFGLVRPLYAGLGLFSHFSAGMRRGSLEGCCAGEGSSVDVEAAGLFSAPGGAIPVSQSLFLSGVLCLVSRLGPFLSLPQLPCPPVASSPISYFAPSFLRVSISTTV